MNNLKYIDHCPICAESKFTPFMSCVDYTVSQKKFNIVSCDACQFYFTNPIPVIEEIGEYYKSESYISHSSTNKGLINKIYQKVRNYTLKQKVKLIQKESIGRNHLDIGAGTGHFLYASTVAGFNALGLEPDADARQMAIDNFKVNIK